MGKRTSVYLSDGVYEAWRASGVPLAELVRQALDAARDDVALRVGRAALGAMGYATPSGTGTTEVPHSDGGSATEVPQESHATHGGTGTTPSGTPVAGKKAATKRTRRAEPQQQTPEPAASLSSLPDVPLTVASALPKPQRCNHPGKRSVGGWCPDCDHLIKPGGLWA